MCDRWDIGGLSTNVHFQTRARRRSSSTTATRAASGSPSAASTVRGLGRRHGRLLDGCPCEHGCPSCVQSPKCGNLNESLDKAGALTLLRADAEVVVVDPTQEVSEYLLGYGSRLAVGYGCRRSSEYDHRPEELRPTRSVARLEAMRRRSRTASRRQPVHRDAGSSAARSHRPDRERRRRDPVAVGGLIVRPIVDELRSCSLRRGERRQHDRRSWSSADAAGDSRAAQLLRRAAPTRPRRPFGQDGETLDDRRAVRRDEGSARRLLPDRRRHARRGDRVGREDPVRPRRRRSRCARSSTEAETRIDDLARAFRDERARCIAILGRVLGDLDLAEDAVQDAFVGAAERWPRDGVPRNPGAWLVTTARNRAIDRIRREQTLARKTELLARAEQLAGRRRGGDVIPDERLELIFACCHPALAAGGAGRADAEPRRRADDAGDRARVPRPGGDARAAARAREAEDPRRGDPAPRAARRTCCPTAARGARRRSISSSTRATGRRSAARAVRGGDPPRAVLATLMPDEAEAHGLLALMLLHDARRDARVSRDGTLVLLDDQDRSLWDRVRIEQGRRALDRALRLRHARAVPAAGGDRRRSTPTRRDRLGADRAALRARSASSRPRRSSSSTARSPSRWPRAGAGLELVDADRRAGRLPPLHSARADLLRRLGRAGDAARPTAVRSSSRTSRRSARSSNGGSPRLRWRRERRAEAVRLPVDDGPTRARARARAREPGRLGGVRLARRAGSRCDCARTRGAVLDPRARRRRGRAGGIALGEPRRDLHVRLRAGIGRRRDPAQPRQGAPPRRACRACRGPRARWHPGRGPPHRGRTRRRRRPDPARRADAARRTRLPDE